MKGSFEFATETLSAGDILQDSVLVAADSNQGPYTSACYARPELAALLKSMPVSDIREPQKPGVLNPKPPRSP